MYKEKRLFFLIAETPVHVGSGSEVGIVDLPIQRERYTGFPKFESSSLKGCIREAFENSNKKISIENKTINVNDKSNINIIFGPEGEETHSGAMAITDAKILLFPVKSLKGVFAWITCPFVLERFKKDLVMIGINDFNFNVSPNTVPKQSSIFISSKVVLEEFTFEVRENEVTTNLAKWFADHIFQIKNSEPSIYQFWSDKMKKDIVILNNDDFVHFVKSSTELITRIKINSDTGTVGEGPWTEEYLPQDTILYSLSMFTSPKVEQDKQKGIFEGKNAEEGAKLVSVIFEQGLPEVIQIGGNQTIGKGFMRVKIFNKQ